MKYIHIFQFLLIIVLIIVILLAIINMKKANSMEEYIVLQEQSVEELSQSIYMADKICSKAIVEFLDKISNIPDIYIK